MTIPIAEITGLLLAGGRGSRMGGVDKGLQPWRGQPLARHAHDRLRPQVGAFAVNANRNADQYRELFGADVPVCADATGDFAGPLAGFLAGLQICRSPWLVTVPCDSPLLPLDLVARLAAAAGRAAAPGALAVSAGAQGRQPQPVFCLLRTDLRDSLAAFLAEGGRKIDRWTAAQGLAEAEFDDETAFFNANTFDDLKIEPDTPPMTQDLPALADIAARIAGYDPNALPVARAQEFIARFVPRVGGVERLALRAVLGRILADDLISPIDVPAHDNSAMDGYALRAADLAAGGTTRLPIAGTGYAGQAFEGAVPPGHCVRIMTGAVMPAGLDTVVPQEFCRSEGEAAWVPAGVVRAGDNRRLRGEDLALGQPALKAGRLIRPADLGLIASLGCAEVPVRRRLRVAFFSTGDELRSIGEPLDAGCVYDSNRYTLHGMLTRLGVDLIDMGVVRDEPAALEAAFRSAAENADAVITSGGVSVGEADYTKQTMARLGEVAFWTIAMRPGRPMAFGKIASGGRQAVLFGLPGNPVAVMVTFYAFVRDALLAMAGATPMPLPMLRAACTEALRKKPGRTEYQRGIVTPAPGGGWQVAITGSQGSGILRSMSEANGLVVLHHEQGSVEAGGLVDVLPFEGLI